MGPQLLLIGGYYTEHVYGCSKCGAIFHESCDAEILTCPKCHEAFINPQIPITRTVRFFEIYEEATPGDNYLLYADTYEEAMKEALTALRSVALGSRGRRKLRIVERMVTIPTSYAFLSPDILVRDCFLGDVECPDFDPCTGWSDRSALREWHLADISTRPGKLQLSEEKLQKVTLSRSKKWSL